MGLSTRQSVGCLILKKEMAGWVQQKVAVLVWLILPLISSFSEQRSSCFRWWLHLQPLAAVAMNTSGRRGVTMLHVTFRPCPFIGDLFFSAVFSTFSAVFTSFSHDCKQASKQGSKQTRKEERKGGTRRYYLCVLPDPLRCMPFLFLFWCACCWSPAALVLWFPGPLILWW